MQEYAVSAGRGRRSVVDGTLEHEIDLHPTEVTACTQLKQLMKFFVLWERPLHYRKSA